MEVKEVRNLAGNLSILSRTSLTPISERTEPEMLAWITPRIASLV